MVKVEFDMADNMNIYKSNIAHSFYMLLNFFIYQLKLIFFIWYLFLINIIKDAPKRDESCSRCVHILSWGQFGCNLIW